MLGIKRFCDFTKNEGMYVDKDGKLVINDHNADLTSRGENKEIYLFAMGGNGDPIEGWPSFPFWIGITPKSYWDEEGCQWDQHISVEEGGDLYMPPGFEEMTEATFVYNGTDEEAISIMVYLGIKFDPSFQEFMEEHNTIKYMINGLSVSEYMEQNYPDSISFTSI